MANVIEIIVRASNAGFNRSAQQVTRGLGSIKKAALGAAAAISGLFTGAAVRNQLEFATELDNINRKLGTTSKFLSELQFVSEQNNVSFQTFTLALQRLTRRLAEVEQTGGGEAAPALEALGIQVEALAGLDTEQRFLLIAEALSRVTEESDRLSIAFKLFFTSGVDVLRITEDGAKGINELREAARLAGKSFDDDFSQGAAKALSDLDRFKASVDSLALGFTQSVLPAIQRVIDGLNDFGTAFRQAIAGLRNDELSLADAQEKLAETQFQLILNEEIRARTLKQLAEYEGDILSFITARRKRLDDLSVSTAELNAQETELQKRIESLTGASEAQALALDESIGKQRLNALAAKEDAAAVKQAADLRAQLAQQQIDAESRLADLRRQGLSESERQRDIELEAARLTIQQVEALAKARSAEKEEERAAALASANAAAERLNALAGQATGLEDQIKLTEEAARVQQEATKIEIAALDAVGAEREKQIREARKEVDALSQTKATIPISFDTTELDRQIAELRAVLEELGANGVILGAGGTISGPAGLAAGGAIPGTGNRDNFPAMLTPGEFVVTKDGGNLADAAAYYANRNQRANRSGRFQDGGPAGSPEVVEIRLNVNGRPHSVYGDRSTARSLANEMAVLGRAMQ